MFGSTAARVSSLSLPLYEHLLRSLAPPPRPSAPHASSSSSSSTASVLASGVRPPLRPWAEDAIPARQARWASVWSALPAETVRPLETRIGDEPATVCDIFGWHFVVRHRFAQTAELRERLSHVLRLPQGTSGPCLDDHLHPFDQDGELPALGRSGEGALREAYLILPLGTEVLQPAFNKLVAPGRRPGAHSLTLGHASEKDLRQLLKPFAVDPLTCPAAAAAESRDPHALPEHWHDHAFSTVLVHRATDPAADETTGSAVDANWWKPAFQLARALAWMQYLHGRPAWSSSASSSAAASGLRALGRWQSLFSALPDSLPFAPTPSPRPAKRARVLLSGLPAMYRTSHLIKHLRGRPDYGAWVGIIRRPPCVAEMDLIADALDPSGLRAVHRALSGAKRGAWGKQRVNEWLGKPLVGASIQKLPCVPSPRSRCAPSLISRRSR